MNTTREEISEIRALALKLRALVGNQISREEEQTLWQMQKQAIRSGSTGRDIFGFNPIVIAFQTALLAVEEMDLKGDAVKAILAFSAIIMSITLMSSAKEMSRLRKFSLFALALRR